LQEYCPVGVGREVFIPFCRLLLWRAAFRSMWLAVRMSDSGGPVNWDGAVNAWHVAGGIFRMGRREWLTELGWKQAYDDGIRTVVDLRNPAEAQRRETDPLVAEAAWPGITVIPAPTEEPGDPRFTDLCGPYLNDPVHYADNVKLFPEKIVAVFHAIAAGASASVLIHCAAGRDRSGMIAAMVQDLAGHSDEDIAAGYARAARGINDRYGTHGPPHARERHLPESELAPLLEARGHAVVAFVRELDTRAFLLEHGLPANEFAALLTLVRGRVPL
jgi:protein-tyrosine phosphatase